MVNWRASEMEAKIMKRRYKIQFRVMCVHNKSASSCRCRLLIASLQRPNLGAVPNPEALFFLHGTMSPGGGVSDARAVVQGPMAHQDLMKKGYPAQDAQRT